MFEGTYTALITPFKAGEVDYQALGKLVDKQIEAGVDGLVPCGSTGESATLSHEEHERVIAFVIERAQKRIKVIAGTGSNSTRESIRLTRFAKEHGADGALLIAPYYNKPTQEGLYAHHSAIADAVALPQLMYNIPGRSAVNISVEVTARLAKHPNIVGIKEACGSLEQISRTIELCGPDFTVLSGDDPLTLPILSVGGRGVIGVTPNLLPREFVALTKAALSGDYASARSLHHKLAPLQRAVFAETNPIGIKAALALVGWCDGELRLPLTNMTEPNQKALRVALVALGLLK
ncbi:MAG TPA: 4-hydroxy-tetrahydrodipicolinate synthase [Polyangiales bacterium]